MPQGREGQHIIVILCFGSGATQKGKPECLEWSPQVAPVTIVRLGSWVPSWTLAANEVMSQLTLAALLPLLIMNE